MYWSMRYKIKKVDKYIHIYTPTHIHTYIYTYICIYYESAIQCPPATKGIIRILWIAASNISH